MKRKSARINNFLLSYLDNEKCGDVLICLHGHFGCASMFSFMESVHNGRLLLIDQRGHGLSDHARSYTREDYINDLASMIEFEHINNPILLGHSLGGVNAYQYTAVFKDVKVLIVEDIGTQVNVNNEFILNLPDSFKSLYELNQAFQRIDLQFDMYFLESAYYDGVNWRFRFDREGMVASANCLNSNYNKEWESIDCPVLLMHGTNSWAVETKNIYEMARRRNVVLKIFENTGHTIRDERRDEYSDEIKKFLENI